MARHDILQRRAVMVTIGVEADINSQAEFGNSVENDPKRTSPHLAQPALRAACDHAATGAATGAVMSASNGRSGRIRNARPAPSSKRQIEPANGRVQLPVRSIR